MRLHSCTPEPAESDDKGRATPTEALIGILEGAAAIIGARCNDLNAAELSTADIAAIRRSVATLDSQVVALKRQFR